MTDIANAEVTEIARAKFATGSDVATLFAKYEDNPEFRVDVFGVKDTETGKVFGVRLMAYDGKTEWKLHSAYVVDRDVWTFRLDARVKAGFKGKILVGATGGKTYAVYITDGRPAKIAHVVPLVDLLHGRTTTITVADYGRLKVAFSKVFGVDANLSTAEDEAVNFRETEVCRKNGLRLVKFASVSGGTGIYRVYQEDDGRLVEPHLRTLQEGYLAIGHIPQAQQTAPGGKTNVPQKLDKPKGEKGGKDGKKKAA